MPSRITRRSAVSILGASGLAGVLAGQLSGCDPHERVASAIPLQVGSRFGRWTVSAIHPIEGGTLQIDVRDAQDRAFVLEVLARDPSPLAPVPPATTDGLAIFVRNGGDGWLPTEEEQGLAAMTLAHLLAESGHGGAIAGLPRHSERVVAHHATLMGDERALRMRLV